MFQCKTPKQPFVNKFITDTIPIKITDTSQRTERIDTIQPKPITPILTTKEIAMKRVDEKLAFFKSLPTQNIDLKYSGKVLKIGDSSIMLIPVKQKLMLLEILHQDSLTIYFDSTLKAALKRFQYIHNIESDGILGKNTFRFLSWPISKYIKELENYQHCTIKSLDNFPPTRIEINIPEYKLRLYSEDTLVKELEVIVGKFKNQTPVLTSKIDYLVFNPCWTVPNSIAGKKILPRLKKDTTYLDAHNMFIMQNGKRKNHHKIDFSGYTKDNFPFKIFQNAGQGNALGRVKFMFRNSHLIYLHDTPSKHLFNRDFRTFSSGCIRVNHAIKLAQFVLKIDSNNANINHKLSKGYPIKTHLNKPLPLIIKYETVRYDKRLNVVQFFHDCYGMN